MGVLKREVLAGRGGDAGTGFDIEVAYAWAAVHGFAGLFIDHHLFVVDSNRAPDAYLGEFADGFLALVVQALGYGSR